MVNEYSFILQMLRDYLNGDKTEKQDNINWIEVIRICALHNINGILYLQCSEFIPSEYELKLCMRYAAELTVYNRRLSLYNEIKKVFSENGVPISACKGFEIAEFYPVPALRTMGDCDLIIKECDLEKGDALMKSIGFERCESEAIEWVYEKDKLKFELHFCLIEDTKTEKADIVKYADTVWDFIDKDKSGDYKLNINFHFVYQLLHIRKHILFSGVGLRQFTDLCVTAKKNQLDWDYIGNTVKNLGLTDFAYACYDFCNRCFGVEFDTDYKKMSDDVFYNRVDTIMQNGTFGFGTDNYKDTYLFSEKNYKNKYSYMLKKYIKLIFPSYSDMCYGNSYNFIKGKPYLLPVGWVYRWFNGIFNKNKKENAVNKMNTLDKKAEKRYNRLSDWGLN